MSATFALHLRDALSASVVLLITLVSASAARAEETQGEDDRYRWMHSEETTTNFVLDDGTEVRIHSATNIIDKRWLKKEADVGPPGEILIFHQSQTLTHTEGWDGSIEDKNSTMVRRRGEYALQLPEDFFLTQRNVKTVPTGPNTRTSDQSSYSHAIIYSPNPDQPDKPISFSGQAEQTLKMKYVGDSGRPVEDEFVNCRQDWLNLPGVPGLLGSTYARRTTWTDAGQVARLAASMDGALAPVPGAIFEFIPAEGWRANGVLIPANRVEETRWLIRVEESRGLGIFPDDVSQQFVPSFLDLALGFGPMA